MKKQKKLSGREKAQNRSKEREEQRRLKKEEAKKSRQMEEEKKKRKARKRNGLPPKNPTAPKQKIRSEPKILKGNELLEAVLRRGREFALRNARKNPKLPYKGMPMGDLSSVGLGRIKHVIVLDEKWDRFPQDENNDGTAYLSVKEKTVFLKEGDWWIEANQENLNNATSTLIDHTLRLTGMILEHHNKRVR
ncbi:MAG: hypothetical protein ABIG20_00560 [archaeon]